MEDQTRVVRRIEERTMRNISRFNTADSSNSTIAQNFAADLDSMFGLTPAVEDLSRTIEQK
jgi:hypothetical protein